MASSTPESTQDRLAAFNEKLRSKGIFAYWMRQQDPDEGRGREEPTLRRWKETFPLLLEAGEIVRVGAEGEGDTFRRNLAGFQVVMPGETAPAHRHTASALRFVVHGNGLAYTTTNGEQMFMEPGDFLVQPNWSWHDHHNDSDEPVVWIDTLDLELVNFLQASFHDEWVEGEVQPVSHSEGYHGRLYGLVRPARFTGGNEKPTPMAYKWRDTLPVLEELAAAGQHDPYDGVILEYTNPATGGHTLPTVSAKIQMLRPGETTRAHRHTSKTKYSVVTGYGVTTVNLTDAQELDWEEKDTFTIPQWRWHQHRNASKTEPAFLWSVSDSPIYQALGLYREEGT